MLPARSHMAILPENRSKWKIDPSRAPGTGGAGIPFAGPDGPAALRDSADTGGWRAVAVGGGRRGGTRDCNNAVRDHSVHRSRTQRDTHRRDKPADAEPLRREPPCPSQGGDWTTAANHVRLEPACCGDLLRVAEPGPCRCYGGVPFPPRA